MFTKNLLLFIFLCLGMISLSAQTIDLGGEDTYVGPLSPPPNSQVYDPTPWATAFSQGVNITSPGVNVEKNKYIYALTDNPGEIINYNELNIFYFLEDYVAFQEYFLYRVYNISRPNIAESDIINYFYPLVRPYRAGTKSYADNPRYMPMVKTTMDSDYTISFNNATTVRSLYELALDMPATPERKPRYLFDHSRSLFDEYIPDIIKELELTIQEEMMNEYGKINPTIAESKGSQIASWSKSDWATVVDKVSKATVTRKEKRIIKELVTKLSEEVEALQKENAALSVAYRSNKKLLNEQEQIWFEWVMRNSKQVFLDLSVTLSYLTEVDELRNNATTYGHFFSTSRLLRETLERMRNLPKEKEANLVLAELRASYLAKVEADALRFNKL